MTCSQVAKSLWICTLVLLSYPSEPQVLAEPEKVPMSLNPRRAIDWWGNPVPAELHSLYTEASAALQADHQSRPALVVRAHAALLLGQLQQAEADFRRLEQEFGYDHSARTSFRWHLGVVSWLKGDKGQFFKDVWASGVPQHIGSSILILALLWGTFHVLARRRQSFQTISTFYKYATGLVVLRHAANLLLVWAVHGYPDPVNPPLGMWMVFVPISIWIVMAFLARRYLQQDGSAVPSDRPSAMSSFGAILVAGVLLGILLYAGLYPLRGISLKAETVTFPTILLAICAMTLGAYAEGVFFVGIGLSRIERSFQDFFSNHWSGTEFAIALLLTLYTYVAYIWGNFVFNLNVYPVGVQVTYLFCAIMLWSARRRITDALIPFVLRGMLDLVRVFR